MPLLKRKAYDFSKPPDNLKAKDLVFQVRFTKEVFKDYEEYLKHVNLYKQRVWTCKYSGKSNLTYEEALESERKTTEKVQQFPREFMGPVLQLVQYSMLRIEDIVSACLKAFRDRFVPGEEVVCVKENVTRPCKILRAIEGQGPEDAIHNYEVELMDNDKHGVGISLESAGNLVRKKPPFTRALVKSFIRESVKDHASRNAQSPLVVQDTLCHKYGITTSPPEELKKYFLKQEQNENEEDEVRLQPLIEVAEGETPAIKKRKKADTEPEGQKSKKHMKVDKEADDHANNKSADAEPENQVKKKQKKLEAGEGRAIPSEDGKSKTKTEPIVKAVPIKYPIEDTLLQPSSQDPPLQERPTLSSDFTLPMECTGPLLMVWNFCSLFAKVIRLSPFSLEDFERALECKDSDTILLREAHHALIKLILSDTAINESFQARKRKRKVQVTIQSWKEDLADLLELEGFEKLAMHSSTIAKGNYKLLEPSVKVEILSQLVEYGLSSTSVREQLDIYIEEKQAIASQKRKEDMEKSKQGREVQELLKQEQIASNTPDIVEETGASVSPKEEEDDDNEDRSDSDEGTDNEEPSSEKVHSNGLIPNGTHENGDSKETTVAATGRSRQLALKLKSEKKQVEDLEKEKKRMEAHKKSQEIRRVKAEAVKERKLQEKKMLELQKRQEHLEREIEKRVIRTHPLGKDRDHNRYWFFAREGRIFVEDKDMSKWGYYGAKEELEALYGSLNAKGIRERALQRQLEKHYNKISDALQRRSKEIAQRVALEDSAIRRSSRSKTGPQQTVEITYRNKYRSS